MSVVGSMNKNMLKDMIKAMEDDEMNAIIHTDGRINTDGDLMFAIRSGEFTIKIREVHVDIFRKADEMMDEAMKDARELDMPLEVAYPTEDEMNGPDLCVACLKELKSQREKKAGIHIACLGKGTAEWIWVICPDCGIPFRCDNGVYNDCGNTHEHNENAEMEELYCASCEKLMGVVSPKALDRSGDMFFCSYECQAAELCFIKAEKAQGTCAHPNWKDCLRTGKECQYCSWFRFNGMTDEEMEQACLAEIEAERKNEINLAGGDCFPEDLDY